MALKRALLPKCHQLTTRVSLSVNDAPSGPLSWRCKSLPGRVKPGRAPTSAVWMENGNESADITCFFMSLKHTFTTCLLSRPHPPPSAHTHPRYTLRPVSQIFDFKVDHWLRCSIGPHPCVLIRYTDALAEQRVPASPLYKRWWPQTVERKVLATLQCVLLGKHKLTWDNGMESITMQNLWPNSQSDIISLLK